MRLCVEHVAEPCALKIDGVFAGASITWLRKTVLGKGEIEKGREGRGKWLYDMFVRPHTCCVCVPDDRNQPCSKLATYGPRSHWHREPPWSSIGCSCDFRLAVDLRIAPRERQFASHSNSQWKVHRALRLHEKYTNAL